MENKKKYRNTNKKINESDVQGKKIIGTWFNEIWNILG